MPAYRTPPSILGSGYRRRLGLPAVYTRDPRPSCSSLRSPFGPHGIFRYSGTVPEHREREATVAEQEKPQEALKDLREALPALQTVVSQLDHTKEIVESQELKNEMEEAARHIEYHHRQLKLRLEQAPEN